MSETRHTVDPKHVIKRQGKDMVLYVGLLDAAHRAGMLAMETEILQYPCAENDHTTIVHARATFPYVIDMLGGQQPAEVKERRHFDGIGDANPRNVGANIAPHSIRMAETRAKARALRDALNVGMVTVEELGADDDDHQPPPARQSRDSAPPVPRPTDRAAAAGEAAATPYARGDQGNERATERQVRFIRSIAKEAGLDEIELEAWSHELYDETVDRLNRRDASTLIEALQRRRNEVA